MAIYQRAGIPEYIILDPPTPVSKERLLLTGHRLGRDGRYARIEPDPEGRLLSETTGLFFGVDQDGRTLRIIDAATGKPLLSPLELETVYGAAREQATREAEARKAAEERTEREAEARKAAESEIARLRAELERLERT